MLTERSLPYRSVQDNNNIYLRSIFRCMVDSIFFTSFSTIHEYTPLSSGNKSFVLGLAFPLNLSVL